MIGDRYRRVCGCRWASACLTLVLLYASVLGCRKAAPTPQGTPDIESEEISWSIGETKVYATVTGPAGRGPYPGIVLVPGSGPTDRNWNSPLLPGTNGSGKLLAEALAAAGYVTIRYDKRFTGKGAGDNLPHLLGKISLEGHQEELRGAVQQLLARPEVEASRLYALAHSEGCIHALYYQKHATENRFAGLALMGAPGQAMADLLRSQVNPQLATLPNGQTLVAHFNRGLDDFLAGRPVEPDPSLPEGTRALLTSLVTPANLPFTREIMPLDPAALLAEVREPALVIIGQKDIQVNWEADGKLLEQAVAGRDNATFAYPADANHLLKHEPTPRAELDPAKVQMGYNAEASVLDQEALDTILEWLRQRGG